MKKSDLLKVWELMKNSKFSKLTGDAKIKYVKMLATLQPVMKGYDEYRDTVAEKLMSEHENFKENLDKAQKYELWKQDNANENPSMTEEEYKAFVLVVNDYNQSVAKALKEEADKEVEVKYDKLTPTEFGLFIDSNDFTGEQALALMLVMEDD